MSSHPIDRLHPVVEFGERLVARLGSLAEVPLSSMRWRCDLDLAQRLESHDLIATGLAAGRVNLAQARAIVGSAVPRLAAS